MSEGTATLATTAELGKHVGSVIRLQGWVAGRRSSGKTTYKITS